MRESAEIQAALELDAIGRTDEAMKRLQASSPRIRMTSEALERARQPAALGQEIR